MHRWLTAWLSGGAKRRPQEPGLSRGFNEVDEIAACIFKNGGCDWPCFLWLSSETYSKCLKALELEDNIIRYERCRRDSCFEERCLVYMRWLESHWF